MQFLYTISILRRYENVKEWLEAQTDGPFARLSALDAFQSVFRVVVTTA
jgi:hypothetical protein